jgi:MSHA pilin protein MshD
MLTAQQNNHLAGQAGSGVRLHLNGDRQHQPINAKQRGISLIELIMFIVIISVAVVGILGVMTQVTRYSADPLLHKQALAAAESLLEEIELQDFIAISTPVNAYPQNNRASQYHTVMSYNGFNTTGIFPVSGTAAIAGLGSYNTSVSVANTALGSIGAASSVLISVTVTDPQGTAITLDGYRTAY